MAGQVSRHNLLEPLAAFVQFAISGAVIASYGPALPALRVRFGLGIAAVGLIVGAQFVGGTAGILTCVLALRRHSIRTRVTAGMAAQAWGTAMVAVSPSWPLMLIGAVAIGWGSSCAGVTWNVHFARRGGKRGAALLNLLNAFYGVGAFLGPVLLAVLTPRHWGVMLGAMSLATLALLPVARAAAPHESAAPSLAGQPLPRPLSLLGFTLVFFVYAGIETTVSAWEPTQLVAAGMLPAVAAGFTSLYWLGFTLGRFGGAAVAARERARTTMRRSLFLVLPVMVMAFAGPAPLAYALDGIIIAPVFAAILLWTSESLPDSPTAVSIAVLGIPIGGAVLPVLTGAWMAAVSPSVLPIAIAAMAATALALQIATDRALEPQRALLAVTGEP